MTATHHRVGKAAELIAHRGADAAASAGPDSAGRLHLAASIDPAEVFASLAAQCVPRWCDSCAIDIDENHPRSPKLDSDTDPQHREAGLADAYVMRVRFTVPLFETAHEELPIAETASDASACAAGVAAQYEGTAHFGWARQPSQHARLAAELLVEHAVRTVAWHRSEDAAREAAAKVANLQVALDNSRHIGAAIGILMNSRKITNQQAFDLLCVASQHSHRKLRELAHDVNETGWLDPVFLPGTAPARALPGHARRS